MKSRRILMAVVAALALAVVVPVAAAAASSSPQPRVAPHILGTWPNDTNMGGAGGYEVWNTGKVVALGHARYYGSVSSPVTDIVGFAADSFSGGYWLIGANGKIYAEGKTCSGQTLQGPANGPRSGVIGAINLSDTFDEGFEMVTTLGRTYSFSCQFTD
jgi:hypothetical protein